MTNKYKLEATGIKPSQLPELSSFVADRKEFKDRIWEKRNNKLVELAEQFDWLVSLYRSTEGTNPKNVADKVLHYKSALAHQIYNTLMATKLDPDFIDYAPLGISQDPELLFKAKALTQAHKLIRYRGGYAKAKQEAKSDFIWGDGFIEMSTRYDETGEIPLYTEYTHAPFAEVRNFYGDTDIMRIIDYPISKYAEIYGEAMLTKVCLGGIVSQENYNNTNNEKKQFDSEKEIIQVVRYYDPARLMFAEIHGGNGYIHKNLKGAEQYPFMRSDGTGYAPFKESRFFQEPNGDYFGWGVLDYILPLANLETTITNATAMEAIWEAAAPSIAFSSNPQDLEKKLQKHFRNVGRGINMPIVQKDSGIGTTANMQSLKKGVDNQNMQVWDDVTVSRATRFASVDVRAMSDYAPTAEQQKLRKIEADKLNIRVMMLNEVREIEFAKNEMEFLKNGVTKFHDYVIEVTDEVSDEVREETGYVSARKMKISEILDGIENLELEIAPRMEGVLDDMDYMEIQTIQDDMAMIQVGTAAYDIAMEKYFMKKNPNWGLTKNDFSAPSMAAPTPEQGGQNQAQYNDPTQALTNSLKTSL